MQTDEPTFRKSSHSGNGDCIEVAVTEGGRAVRDSKDPAVGVAFVAAAGWAAFIDGVKDGSLTG